MFVYGYYLERYSIYTCCRNVGMFQYLHVDIHTPVKYNDSKLRNIPTYVQLIYVL